MTRSYQMILVAYYLINMRFVKFSYVLLFCVSVNNRFSLQIMNVRQILTSPALLESTSLVFVYGLDLFFTRVAQSNTFDVLSESFNKPQLVSTIAGLALAIAVVKPIVTRKRLQKRWYD